MDFCPRGREDGVPEGHPALSRNPFLRHSRRIRFCSLLFFFSERVSQPLLVSGCVSVKMPPVKSAAFQTCIFMSTLLHIPTRRPSWLHQLRLVSASSQRTHFGLFAVLGPDSLRPLRAQVRLP